MRNTDTNHTRSVTGGLMLLGALAAALLLGGCGARGADGGPDVLTPDFEIAASPAPTPAPTATPEPSPAVTPVGPGSMTLSYSDQIVYRLGSDSLSMFYRNVEGSDNDVTVKVYLLLEDGEHLLAASDVLPPNSQVTSLAADAAELPEKPAPGGYQGVMRLEFFREGESAGLLYSTELPCAITAEE